MESLNEIMPPKYQVLHNGKKVYENDSFDVCVDYVSKKTDESKDESQWEIKPRT